MTTAEAREKLIKYGLPEGHAAGVADVLEVWGQERAVTKDYLDKVVAQLETKLAQLETKLETKLAQMETKLFRMEARIYGGIGLMLIVQHFWK